MIIYIPGPPIAQSRPRFARMGQHVRTYDATPARDYKSWVKCCAIDAMKDSGCEMFRRDTPLEMTVDISLQRPKTLPKRVIYPTNKPDTSNVLKGIEDALEGIAYEADQQIVSTTVKKAYGVPGVLVEIREFVG
jgi:Holliday junction resolvase RusA-like endonuclease